MTVPQAGEYLQAQQEYLTEMDRIEFERTAMFNEALALQITSGVAGLFSKRAKFLTKEKIFKEYYKDKQKKEKTQAEIWLEWLNQ